MNRLFGLFLICVLLTSACNTTRSVTNVAYTVFESGAGYAITKVNSDKYTFTLGATPTVTENGGGMTVTAGPVTLTP